MRRDISEKQQVTADDELLRAAIRIGEFAERAMPRSIHSGSAHQPRVYLIFGHQPVLQLMSRRKTSTHCDEVRRLGYARVAFSQIVRPLMRLHVKVARGEYRGRQQSARRSDCQPLPAATLDASLSFLTLRRYLPCIPL
jgi:hypothetical protein